MLAIYSDSLIKKMYTDDAEWCLKSPPDNDFIAI